jgi:hypothetical protein
MSSLDVEMSSIVGNSHTCRSRWEGLCNVCGMLDLSPGGVALCDTTQVIQRTAHLPLLDTSHLEDEELVLVVAEGRLQNSLHCTALRFCHVPPWTLKRHGKPTACRHPSSMFTSSVPVQRTIYIGSCIACEKQNISMKAQIEV